MLLAMEFDYKAGIKIIQFYMKSYSNVYMTYENAEDVTSDTSAGIEKNIFL